MEIALREPPLVLHKCLVHLVLYVNDQSSGEGRKNKTNPTMNISKYLLWGRGAHDCVLMFIKRDIIGRSRGADLPCLGTI